MLGGDIEGLTLAALPRPLALAGERPSLSQCDRRRMWVPGGSTHDTQGCVMGASWGSITWRPAPPPAWPGWLVWTSRVGC